MLPSLALTKNKIKSTKTLLSPAEGEREGLADEEGEADADGLRDLEALLDAEPEGDADPEGEPLGLRDALALELGDND